MRWGALIASIMAACGMKPAGERGEFHGITYVAPKGTHRSSSGVDRPSHYPDPKTGQVIEIATRIEPAISLMIADTYRFFVSIKKPPERVTLEGMKAALAQRPEISDIQGHAEKDGWTVSYKWPREEGKPATLVLRRYVFADSDYECVYDDGATQNVDEARAICASIRPKP